MEDLGRHYIALGLRPGATREEIRSAFRRMAQMYHPDKDSSLDAEMRYREARLAYDSLRKAADTRFPRSHTHSRGWTGQTARGNNYGPRAETPKPPTSSGAGWFSYDGAVFGNDLFRRQYGVTGVNLDELMWEHRKEDIKKRIPFSLEKMPDIIWESIKEAACVGIVFRVLLYAAGMRFMFYALRKSGVGVMFGSRLLSNMFIFCPLIGFALYRYYFPRYPTECEAEDYKSYSNSRLLRNLAVSFLYGMGASFLIHALSPGLSVSLSSWFDKAISVFFMILPLWVG
ncbi:MAG: DnaJ domain-containing protein [Synergistaceae bacterium]|nr:DnaJ domain-containing protein [Synergistaceae bacterium]